MPKLTRRVTPALADPRLAIGLMLFLGSYAFLGTLVPQGATSSPEVTAWAIAHPVAERLVRAVGFHEAFSSPVFVACVALLAASTAVCAWRRTRVARTRYQAMRDIRRGAVTSYVRHPAFTLQSPVRHAPDAAALIRGALRSVGLKPRRQGDVVTASPSPFVALGSPVFHWSLVALIATLALSALTRTDGLMGIPVGDALPNLPGSYRVLSAGPLHSWSRRPVLVAVDRFDPAYVIGGIDRGPTPVVTIRSADGHSALASGRVFPNHALRYGSLTVHVNDYGLAPTFALVGSGGRELGRASTLVDFDATSPGGTAPGAFALADQSGREAVQLRVSIPLVGRPVAGQKSSLSTLRARIVLTSAADKTKLAEGTLGAGDELALPDGTKVRFLGVDYYARLSVVDDWTIPLLYAVLTIAVVSVGVALLATPRAVIVVVQENPAGVQVAVTFRNWRGVAFDADEIQTAIRERLPTSEEEGFA
jgi:cytochrome c biogenesis protein ResB